MKITGRITTVMEAVIANRGRSSSLKQEGSYVKAIMAYITAVMSLRHAITAPFMTMTHVLGTQLLFFSKFIPPSVIYVFYLFDKLLYDTYNYS